MIPTQINDVPVKVPDMAFPGAQLNMPLADNLGFFDFERTKTIAETVRACEMEARALAMRNRQVQQELRLTQAQARDAKVQHAQTIKALENEIQNREAENKRVDVAEAEAVNYANEVPMIIRDRQAALDRRQRFLEERRLASLQYERVGYTGVFDRAYDRYGAYPGAFDARFAPGPIAAYGADPRFARGPIASYGAAPYGAFGPYGAAPYGDFGFNGFGPADLCAPMPAPAEKKNL